MKMMNQVSILPMMPERMVLSFALSKLLWDRAELKSNALLTLEEDGEYVRGLRDGGMAEAGPVAHWLQTYKTLTVQIEKLPAGDQDDDWK